MRLGLSATVELRSTGTTWSPTCTSQAATARCSSSRCSPPTRISPAAPRRTRDLLFERPRVLAGWIAQSSYMGRWRETVNRSALTLKMLCHEPSGGIVAAATTSLPERIGGARNWDYRYVWVRDAGFSLYALLRLGFLEEAAPSSAGSPNAWVKRRRQVKERGPLRVLYDLDGNVPEHEVELDHLSGYAGSRPVRVGNAAAGQLQLDIYGDLIDSVYLFNKYGPGISYEAWRDLTDLVGWLMDNWDRPDAGMWESRGEPRSTPPHGSWDGSPSSGPCGWPGSAGSPGTSRAWSRVRDEIYTSVMEHCWDPETETFTQSEGSDAVDAGLLLMPR